MFVGREKELEDLKQLLNKNVSSMAVVYGRRRVGKTQTIRHFIKENNLFNIEITGVHGASKNMQIKSFARNISLLWDKDVDIGDIKSWQDLFFLLEDFIETIKEKKKVIFLDEFPWLDTKKSNFLQAFSHFWNNFCTKRDDILLIVCGSSATYMKDKFIKNKKTLHGRDSLRINMRQFDLATAKKMLHAKGCRYSHKSIVDAYFVFGGVAKYLDGLDCTKTLSENVDLQCFDINGLLKTEYKELYSSLFNNAKWHYKIMDLLSSKWSGYTQKELILNIGASPCVIKDALEDLESAGFIYSIGKFNQNVRDRIFRAGDSFSYFYTKWMRGFNSFDEIYTSQKYRIWSGFAFENICFTHSNKIKEALGISGVPTKTHYWHYRDKNQKGAQIDMLLEHTNGSKNIDIIECKYHDSEFIIDKQYYENLKNKISIFNSQTKFKYNIRLIFVSVNGVARNKYYNEIVQKQILVSDLV